MSKITQYKRQLRDLLETEHDFPGPNVTKITDFLFLGNEQNACDVRLLSDIGITHIINCCEQDCSSTYKVPQNVTYMQLSAKDDVTYNIMQHFSEVHDFIEKARSDNGKILIHCIYGSNRSGALAISYVMLDQRKSPLVIAGEVKSKRGVVLTNEAFQSQVVDFAVEKEIPLELN